MKVSIITVSRNSSSTILETIHSVLEQTYSDIQHIFIDGNSQDETVDIIKQNTQNPILLSEKDNGIYDAMNKGIRLASGDIIGILNSDDMYASKYVIQQVVDQFKENISTDAVYGNLVFFKSKYPNKVVRKWFPRKFDRNFFQNGNAIPHPTLFVKKKVYDLVGLYNPNFKISSDYEFALRAFYMNTFQPQYLDKLIIKMRHGGESTKSWKNILVGNREVFESWSMNKQVPPLRFYFLRYLKKGLQLLLNF
jgi:glycosyltransferase